MANSEFGRRYATYPRREIRAVPASSAVRYSRPTRGVRGDRCGVARKAV